MKRNLLIFLASFSALSAAFIPQSDSGVNLDELLERGTVYTYENINTGSIPKYSGKETVQSVTEHPTGLKVIRTEMIENNDKEIFRDRKEYFYAKDSTCFYVFAQNWQNPLSNPEDKFAPNDFSGDTLEYPFAMKVGDTLLDGHSHKHQRNSPDHWGHFIEIKSRKVAAHDTLDLGFALVPAFRITCLVKYHHETGLEEYNNSSAANSVSVATEWFSPRYGIVQTEVVRGGVKKRVTLTGISRK